MCERLVYALFLFLFDASVNGKPEADAGQRIRKVGKMQVLRKAVLPGFYLPGKCGFGQSGHHHALMEYVREGVVVFHVFYNIRNRSDGLERDAGQGVEGGLVPEPFLREAEDHHGSSTQMIENHVAGVRDEGLCLVYVQNIKSSCVKNLVDNLKLSVICQIALASGNLRQSRFRDVVLGWTKTSGSDDYLVVNKLVCQIVYNFVMVIPERDHSGDFHSNLL